ncbi:Uncharacterised protein [Bordetella pertussis]|nr:Uncharacterised protein [Bordetella pertussis]
MGTGASPAIPRHMTKRPGLSHYCLAVNCQ